jgi:branched-chain amino acid transport system substrate-binding protein
MVQKTLEMLTRRSLIAGAAGAAALPFVVRAQSAGVIKIAHLQSLTGPSAPYGIRGRDGARLAVEDINSAGGAEVGGQKLKVEIIDADIANDARQAVTLFRQFAGDASIVAVLGPINSVGFLPCIPVAGQSEIPLIGNGSLAPVKEWNPWAYRENTISAVATQALLRAVVPHEKIKRLAVIFDQTQDNQVGDSIICKNLARELGYELVASEAFRAGDQDFSPQLATIRRAKPDAIYVAAATGDGVKLVSQLRELGLQQRLLTGSGSFLDTVFWDNTNGRVKDDYTWIAQDFSSPSSGLKSFITRYNKQFPQQATLFSVNGYDSVMVAAEALKRAGAVDRKKMQKALSDLDMTTPLGTNVKFVNPPSGDNIKGSAVIVKITGRGTYVRL